MPKKNEKKSNNRADELLEMLPAESRAKASRLVEEIVFIENQMTELKKLPFIRVSTKDPEKQKSTPAAKLYKEYVQQYNNSLKLLLKLCGDLKDTEEESPLRQWLRKRGEENV